MIARDVAAGGAHVAAACDGKFAVVADDAFAATAVAVGGDYGCD